MSPHGGKDYMKRRREEKERKHLLPEPGSGRCCLCGEVNPKSRQCPDSAIGGHIILEEEHGKAETR